MNREEAIEYLENKGKIRKRKFVKPKYSKKELVEIETTIKEGKIYGDPIARIQW